MKEVERGRIEWRMCKIISGRGWERAGCKVLEMRSAGKSEFGVCGVVGGMMVIERMRGNARRRIGG